MEEKREKLGRFQVKQIGDPADRVLRFVGTDESEDRDGDVIKADGWKFENYMKNPVFLWCHDSWSVPLARCLSITRGAGSTGTEFDIKFATIEELSSNPETPSREALLADTVYMAYVNGYLNAVSVGFIGLESEENESNKEIPAWQRGRIFTSQEMIELSAVPIPANPNALVQARSFKGFKPGQVEILEELLTPKAAGNAVATTVPAQSKEPEMKKDEVDKAIADAVEKAVKPLQEQIEALKTAAPAVEKAGAKFSAATLSCLTEALDHIMKGHGMLKGLMDGSGEEPDGQSPGDTEPGTDRDGDVPAPEDMEDDSKAYGIDLTKINLAEYQSA